jgi:hypothetical protein
MLPILISLSVTPGSYFFSAAAGFMPTERPSTIDASRMFRPPGCRRLLADHVAVQGLATETCLATGTSACGHEADLAPWSLHIRYQETNGPSPDLPPRSEIDPRCAAALR